MHERIDEEGIGDQQAAGPETARVGVPIFGLGMGGCGAETVEHALRRVPGVQSISVNPATEMAYITYDAIQTDLDELRRAIEAAGVQAGARETWSSLSEARFA